MNKAFITLIKPPLRKLAILTAPILFSLLVISALGVSANCGNYPGSIQPEGQC